MTSVRTSVRRDPARVGMAVLWTAFLVAYIGFFYYFKNAREIADAELDGYLEVILLGVPLVVLFGSIVWMSESDVETRLHYRVVAWTITVAGLFLVAVWTSLFILEPQYDRGEFLLMLLMGAGFGASMGSVTGFIEARSINHGRAQERAVVEARRRKHEQQRLEYLNQYLRHEVLNEVNKIDGYARLLEGHLNAGDEAHEWARIIAQSSDDVGTFVASIRSIMNADDLDLRIQPTDVTAVTETVADRVRARGPDTTIDVDAPGPVYAAAGEMLDRVFVNLFENAVEHGSRSTRRDADAAVEGDDAPTVRVAVRNEGDDVTVRIEDDGPGLSESARESLFEPPDSGDHGYGLFLSRNLVELYGGRLELDETGPDGTTFTVRLDVATPPEETGAHCRVAEAATP